MKLSIQNKEELKKHLEKVYSVITPNNTQPALDNICLEIRDKDLSIRGTDMEVSIETSLRLEKESEAGGITIPAKSFQELVKALPEDTEVRIQTKENNWVSICCGNTKFNLAGRSIEEYPTLPEFSQRKFHSIDVEAFTNMMNYTSFAVSKDESRYQMTGVYLGSIGTKKKEGLDSYMVATDGHRLTYCEKKLFTKGDSFLGKREEGFIIPEKGIDKVKKLSSHCAELMMAWEKNHLIFKIDQSYVLIRLIEGKFPDHNRILPKEIECTFKAKTKELLESVKQVSWMTTNTDSVGVKIKLSKNKLSMFTNNPSLGEGNVEIKVDYVGEDIEIAFNAKYLEESIKHIKEEELNIFFNSYNRPGVVRVPEANYVSVLMPMRI